MTHARLFALLCCIHGVLSVAAAEEPAAPAVATPPVKDEELQRISRIASDVFPWVKAQQANPDKGSGATVAPPKAPPVADTGMPGMSGDVIIRELGDFSAAPGITPDKQRLTLTKDVIVEQLDTKSVLRAQKFMITRDLKTGSTDLMEARGSVEMVMPGQKGKGESLNYETRFGPHGEIVKNLFTLEGNRTTGKRAYLWLGLDPDPEKNDKIEANRFINDRRLETFHAQGSPAAVVTMQPQGAAAPGQPPRPAKSTAPAKTGAKTASTGLLPNMDALTSGGVVRLQCDGEMFFEGPSGRLTMTNNAIIQQEATLPNGLAQTVLKLSADESHLIMEVPPPGQSPEGSSMFSGDLKKIECIGRVEMKTVTHVVLCDRCTIDVKENSIVMEMKNPKDDVRIFIKDDAQGSRALSAKRSFSYNMTTEDMQSPFGMKTENLPTVIPTNRPALKPPTP